MFFLNVSLSACSLGRLKKGPKIGIQILIFQIFSIFNQAKHQSMVGSTCHIHENQHVMTQVHSICFCNLGQEILTLETNLTA